MNGVPADRVDAAGAANAVDAQDALLRALAIDDAHPSRALAELGLTPELLARAMRLALDFERSADIEATFVGEGAVIEHAVAAIRAEGRRPIDRSVPGEIGVYRITRTISLGPNSAVLVADQRAPIQREVALKLLFDDARDERLAMRVEFERQILATLEHPNIARIYDFGIDAADRPYLVMELVRDGSVTSWATGHRLPLRARVELFLQVMSAVRFAHARGVLHLDLKPANILVQELAGAPVVKVIDFGVARAFGGSLAERAALADLPRALGTLLWMAPETLDGSGGVRVGGPDGGAFGAGPDVRADVYGLGLVLFELLTGRPPRVAGADAMESLRRALEDPIASVRSVDAAIPVDLEAVVARATAREPSDRYQTVEAMGADLERWLRGDELDARRWGSRERFVRGMRRSRRLVAVGGTLAVLAAVAATLAIGTARARMASLAEARAEVDRRISEANRLREVPGREEAHSIALHRALDAVARAQALVPDDALVLSQRAQIVEDMTVAALLQGRARDPEVGRLAAEAVGIRRELVRRAPDDAEALERLSLALAYQLDTLDAAIPHSDLARIENEQLAIDEQLHAQHPDSRRYADNLAWTHTRVGGRKYSYESEEAARPHLLRVRELSDRVLERYPEVPVTHYTAMAGALYGAIAQIAEVDLDATRRDLALAIERGERAMELDPGNRRIASMFVHSAAIAAQLAVHEGRFDDALAIGDRALEHGGPLLEGPGNFTLFSVPTLDLLDAQASAAIQLGDDALARRILDRAEAHRERERAVLVVNHRVAPARAVHQIAHGRIAALAGEHSVAAREFEAAKASFLDELAQFDRDPQRGFGSTVATGTAVIRELAMFLRELDARRARAGAWPEPEPPDAGARARSDALLETLARAIVAEVDAALSTDPRTAGSCIEAQVWAAEVAGDLPRLRQALAESHGPRSGRNWAEVGIAAIEARLRRDAGEPGQAEHDPGS